jgi:hypothetical membrane protein
MARWILKPVLIVFGTLLLVYVMLLNQNAEFSGIIRRFDRVSALLLKLALKIFSLKRSITY